VDIAFEVSGALFTLPEGQATILAEKLRLFAAGGFRDAGASARRKREI
jgi:hypothetical protein